MHSIGCTSPPLSRPSCGFLERESVTRSALVSRRLTTLTHARNRSHVDREKPLMFFYVLLLARGLRTRAGNLAPVPAEDELLDVVRDVLTDREKSHARETRVRAADDLRRKTQRLNDDVAHRDLEDAVRTRTKAFPRLPDRAHRVEADLRRRRARLRLREQLADQVEQHVELEIETHEVGRVWRI